MTIETLLLVIIGLPFAGTVLIVMSDGRPNQRETVTIATAVHA